ncbi:heavy-metal-associated domain-containing protein [Paenibacillus filicis]|uniref:Heavy-metal-associated domain-containing protein n=1 Tax=Paenibacillus gyeongsangnamensis TaxID=3388067 RepID=A0ABT4QBN9_9BACL|nr:heavy-metal-associated domain-containing protein [Paenibacillus filicis]MCZ8514298.1 heavy-metal-associated domain-containing protein [Paenibacillus filicis]
MITKMMIVQGLTRQSDADKVSHALREIWGVKEVEVNLNRKEVKFSYDESAASYKDCLEAVVESGYPISLQDDLQSHSLHDWQLEKDSGGIKNAPYL